MYMKHPSRRTFIILSLFALIIIMSCATYTPRVAQVTPITLGPEGSAPITFTRLVIRIPSGTEIGGHHDGLLKIRHYGHIWLSNIAVASDEFKIVASEHLKSRGYSVLGGDNLLFGKDESAKAEYQLGGTITTLTYNTFAPLAGNFSESSLSIEWQLYDAFQKKVVYTSTTSGFGTQGGVGSACIQTAFRSVLDNLLADSRFVSTVKRSPREMWDLQTDALTTIAIKVCTSQDTLLLPKDLDLVLKSVLLIRAGETTGSGILISEDGWALTAAHVVSGLDEVVAIEYSGIELTAEVVRIDNQQDVALIRLQGRGHPCSEVATENVPTIGSDVLAVGAPFGEELAFSVTKGVVSGMRQWQGKHYIQTDAALNPGNSGGPLLSMNGKIMGIISWKISAPGFEGLAFGVPVKTLADRLGISLESDLEKIDKINYQSIKSDKPGKIYDSSRYEPIKILESKTTAIITGPGISGKQKIIEVTYQVNCSIQSTIIIKWFDKKSRNIFSQSFKSDPNLKKGEIGMLNIPWYLNANKYDIIVE